MYSIYMILLIIVILLMILINIYFFKIKRYNILLQENICKIEFILINDLKNQKYDFLELNNLTKSIKSDLMNNIYNILEQTRLNNKFFQENFDKNFKNFSTFFFDKLNNIENNQEKLIINIDKELEKIREIVDDKLQKTLNDRINYSFQTVNNQLKYVQEGLGEMKGLAQDVGSLKKVLNNVKMCGNLGEFQLSMLLDQILAPEQYETNVKTKKGSNHNVEFAIKLPGKNDEEIVWIPIDAKFPKESYERLQNSYDKGNIIQIEKDKKNLEIIIKKMAKDIKDKYIDPPNTTDFAILFLPFEGIYSEIVKKAKLLDELQRNYKIIIAGPTTLAAILNSLQIGFRTLAIQKRSSEVWQILGDVKKEFNKFSDLLINVQKHIRSASDQIDEVAGRRTKLLKKKLNNVETINYFNINK